MSTTLDYQQAIFWGNFIQVCAKMYVPGVTNPPQPSKFPTGWKIVRYINAQAVVPFCEENEFIGFIVQSIDNPSQFGVVLHGSEGVADYLDDFKFTKTDFTLVADGGKAEYGFTRFYESFLFIDPVSGDAQTLEAYLSGLSRDTSFVVAGHSLGAALATLHTMVLASRSIPVEAYLFASPMVGDAAFVNKYTSLVKNSHLIVNQPDIVPRLPGTVLGYEHVTTQFEVNSLEFPAIKRSISCFHALNVYLYAMGAHHTNLKSCQA